MTLINITDDRLIQHQRNAIVINFHRSFQLVYRTATTVLLAITVWMCGLPAFSAFAISSPTSGTPTHLTEGDSAVARSREMRIDAIGECRKYLANGDKNTVADLDRPLDKRGSHQLVGALKVSDNPEPTKAEVEFKRCLEEKGIAPKP
ncbi:hypothetical protein [Aerosakkonema funiforme]|uniref:hypothetical protein n=1 Tax=Aerosakkonema funiforme TaxID=1246630 RepID=UPI0035BA7194